jgi:hypothetical protein
MPPSVSAPALELPPIEEIYPEPVVVETAPVEIEADSPEFAQAEFESDRIDVSAFRTSAEDNAEAEIGSNPPPFAEEIAEEPRLAVQADMPSLPVEPLSQPAKPKHSAPAEDVPVLIPRKLPGIAKPIVMTVQNQGPERFKFLKKLARKA